MAELTLPNPVTQIDAQENTQALNLTLKIEGMKCSACSALLQKNLQHTPGVLEADVFFLSDIARLTYLPHHISPQEIMAKIAGLGYYPSLFRDQWENAADQESPLLRMGICLFLTANIMMLSFALYCGFFQVLSPEAVWSLSIPLWALATLVVFYGGFPIIKRAVIGLRSFSLSMDTLICIGVLATYCYSVTRMARGSLHLYFDTAAMLVSLVILGRYIEAQARAKVAKKTTELYQLAHQKVRLETRGEERWVPAEAVKPGCEFSVRSGERIPLDGCIISGQANLDESVLTGESRPVRKSCGAEVMGGALLLDGALTIRATRVGSDGSLGRMIHLMQEALNKKNSTEILADRIMQWIIPVVLILAAGTVFYLRLHAVSMDEALLRAVTVLVITCPCALGIATPLAKVACMGVARDRGVMIQNPAALEWTKDLEVLVFDKTGTITRGNFTLQDIVLSGVSEKEVFFRVAAVEAHCDHFLAREILRKAKQASVTAGQAEGFEALEGLGVKGVVKGDTVAVGNRRLMHSQGMQLAPAIDREAGSLELQGRTIVFFGWTGEVRGFFGFGDCLKDGAVETIQALKARGVSVWLVSGDAADTTRAVAKKLGIDQFQGQALPQDKVRVIEMLQQEGKRVGMVGDGINDAAALAQAHVGFALGTRTSIAQEAADIGLLSDNPGGIPAILDLSALAMKTIRQNLFFAFFYNVVCIPLAMAGTVNPIVAVVAMFASSLTVIGNTVRISKKSINH